MPYNEEIRNRACGNALGLVAKCILQINHKGPHTDGNQQWKDKEPEQMESNHDIQQRENSLADEARYICICANPGQPPVAKGCHHHECPLAADEGAMPEVEVVNPGCTLQCGHSQGAVRCLLTIGHTGLHQYPVGEVNEAPIPKLISITKAVINHLLGKRQILDLKGIYDTRIYL